MHSQNDVIILEDRPQRHRRSRPMLAGTVAALALVLNTAQLASTFTTPFPHRQLLVKGAGAQHQHHDPSRNHKSSFYQPIGLTRHGTTHPAKTKRTTPSLQARSPPPIDEEEFQRSLLEARIANDVKSTIVKEEKERHEVIAKKIDQEKEELQDAVQEVKDAVREISQSAKSLGGAVIGTSTEVIEAAVDVSKSAFNLGGALVIKAPRIFTRLFTLMATSETR